MIAATALSISSSVDPRERPSLIAVLAGIEEHYPLEGGVLRLRPILRAESEHLVFALGEGRGYLHARLVRGAEFDARGIEVSGSALLRLAPIRLVPGALRYEVVAALGGSGAAGGEGRRGALALLDRRAAGDEVVVGGRVGAAHRVVLANELEGAPRELLAMAEGAREGFVAAEEGHRAVGLARQAREHRLDGLEGVQRVREVSPLQRGRDEVYVRADAEGEACGEVEDEAFLIGRIPGVVLSVQLEEGHAGGIGMDNVIKLATDCLEKPWPDLTIILDVDSATAATRLKSNLDRMEQKGDSYHKRVRDGFLKIAKQQKNFVVVNAAGNIDAVHKKVTDIVEKFGAE